MAKVDAAMWYARVQCKAAASGKEPKAWLAGALNDCYYFQELPLKDRDRVAAEQGIKNRDIISLLRHYEMPSPELTWDVVRWAAGWDISVDMPDGFSLPNEVEETLRKTWRQAPCRNHGMARRQHGARHGFVLSPDGRIPLTLEEEAARVQREEALARHLSEIKAKHAQPKPGPAVTASPVSEADMDALLACMKRIESKVVEVNDRLKGVEAILGRQVSYAHEERSRNVIEAIREDTGWTRSFLARSAKANGHMKPHASDSGQLALA